MRGISDRPSEVADRLVAGQREGDLIVGRYGRSHLVTLVERHSRFLLVLPVPDATTVTVVDAVTRAFLELPDSVRGSLTWDRGVEMTNRSPLWAEELRREESRRAAQDRVRAPRSPVLPLGSASRCASLVVVPGRSPASTSACATQLRSVSGCTASCSPTRSNAPFHVRGSRRRSIAIRIARSAAHPRTSSVPP